MFYILPEREFKQLDSEGYFTNEFRIAKDLAFRSKEDFHYEARLIHWCNLTFIDPKKDFVDIGAHIGTWSWVCGEKANKTHAFECNNEVYNCLCANIYLKNLSNKVFAHKCGLSNKTNQKMTYYKRSLDGGGNGLAQIHPGDSNAPTDTVNVFKLDDFNLDNVGFLKLDVEGYEREVLEGAQNTLKINNYPPFVFESWPPSKEKEGVPAVKLREELFGYINDMGYNIIPIAGCNEQFLAEYKRNQ